LADKCCTYTAHNADTLSANTCYEEEARTSDVSCASPSVVALSNDKLEENDEENASVAFSEVASSGDITEKALERDVSTLDSDDGGRQC
jgi:hypothetical protein